MAKTAPTGAIPKDVASLSFEEALSELEKIVRELEEGKVKLNDAIGAYERGAALKRHCEAKLSEAKAKVDKIVLGPEGGVGTVGADID
ncbi:MAG: exodeoxyribonuclease VII small subunit [Alphaproteobacteria bacterium]